MEEMDLATVRKELSAILRDGREVLITRYGKVVGRIGPLTQAPAETDAGDPAEWIPVPMNTKREDSLQRTKSEQARRDELLRNMGPKRREKR